MNAAPQALARAQRRLADAGGRHIGDLISWNCDRLDVGRSVARELLAVERFEHLIVDVDLATALSRSVSEVRRPPGILVRPFARPKGDTSAAFGVYVQNGRDGEGGDDYVCGARCRVDAGSSSVIALGPDGAAVVEEALLHAEELAAHANHVVTHAMTKDVSSAMVAIVKALSGVPLRDRGGFYLLPPSTCARWQRLRHALGAIGVEPIRVEMHDAPDNVAAAKSAAQGALEADVHALMADLAKASTDGMRQHALTRRVETCKELVAKAELYKGVLAEAADQITARVEDLRREFQRHLDADGDAAFAVAVND